MQKPTRDDLIKAFEAEPTLTDGGIDLLSSDYQKRLPQAERTKKLKAVRDDIKDSAQFLRMFQVCCAWLSLCETRKAINPKIGTSYSLKHRVERYFGEYVTNGAFIAAVIHMEIPYRTFPDFPNVQVALSSRGLPKDVGYSEPATSLDTIKWTAADLVMA